MSDQIHAAAARAMIRALGMQAENWQRVHRGESMAYTYDDFLIVIEEEGIDYNSVQEALSRAATNQGGEDRE